MWSENDPKQLVTRQDTTTTHRHWRTLTRESSIEFILYHAIRVGMDAEHTTLLGVYKMLTHEDYRARLVRQVDDPLTRDFWQRTFAEWPERYRLEAVGAIENKLGRFLGSSAIHNILGQEDGKLSLDFIINNRRIFIAN